MDRQPYGGPGVQLDIRLSLHKDRDWGKDNDRLYNRDSDWDGNRNGHIN